MAPSDLSFLNAAEWLNEPPEWRMDEAGLELVTGERTDFWQDTYYGFHRDDGHMYGCRVNGDFSAVVTFEGEYQTLYDQAGLMMRVDENNWLKAGVEFSDGATNFSVVVTRTRSDWSVVNVPGVEGPQQLRLTRIGGAVLVHFCNAHGRWTLLRLADFPGGSEVVLGPMACSPQRVGFRARFTRFSVEVPVENPLHCDD